MTSTNKIRCLGALRRALSGSFVYADSCKRAAHCFIRFSANEIAFLKKMRL